MARADQKFMLDGFTAVQAVRRTAPHRDPSAKQSPSSASASKQASAAAHKPPHAGRTTMPSRTPIVCYICDYEFVVTGRIDKTVLCPKCREFLTTRDIVLDTADAGDVRTVGTVTVVAGVVLDGEARVVARRLRVAGDARRATLACRSIAMDDGGQVDLARTTFREMSVSNGADCVFTQDLACRTLEVMGFLNAHVRAAEWVSIHPGAGVRGAITTPRLIVMDAARLDARLCIGEAALRATPG